MNIIKLFSDKEKEFIINSHQYQLENSENIKIKKSYKRQLDNFLNVKEWKKQDSAPTTFSTYQDLVNKLSKALNKEFDIDGNKISFVPYEKNGRLLLLCPYWGKCFIKVKINDIPVIFYNSTGKSWKVLKPWMFYPTIGIWETTDKERGEITWIVKTNSEDMAIYYWSDLLRKVAAFLDRNLGNTNTFYYNLRDDRQEMWISSYDIENFIWKVGIIKDFVWLFREKIIY